MYFDLGFLRVGSSTVPLEEDIHIASLIRAISTVVLKPQTATVCMGKLKDSTGFPSSQIYSVTATETIFISNEPGLMVSNSVAKLAKNRVLPVMVVNNTNRTIRPSKGSVIAKVELITQTQVNSLDSVKRQIDRTERKDWTAEVDVPQDHKSTILGFLQKQFKSGEVSQDFT